LVDVVIKARHQFGELLTTDKRWSIAVCHRRAGKTVACVQKLIRAALLCKRPDPRFAYVAPLYNQAKDVAWTYLKRLAYPLGGVANETELRIDLPGGARIRLYGADNPDRLRGLYLDGAVLDEYADMQPSVWGEIIRPMLADRQGWAAFIGTPKGHNAFYKLWEDAKADANWFTLMLRASETGLIADAELEDARRTMTTDQYAQEFDCSFDAAIQGAYYGQAIADARKQNRIGKVGKDPLMPFKAFWDIGVSDATAIWIAQFVGREIRVLDYYEAVRQPLATHVEWLRSAGYGRAECVLPHDAAKMDAFTAIRFEDHLRAAGFHVVTIPNQGKGAALKRVESARRLFPSIWFNEATTRAGIEALSAYHEKIDEKRNVGLGPEHDWASHGADAFGLMCVAYDAPYEQDDDEDDWRDRHGSRSAVTGY
jgi:phage terminase large subunit